MTKQTKLELVQINARIAADNASLIKQVADQALQIEMLQRQVGGLKDLISIHKEHAAKAAATPAPANDEFDNVAPHLQRPAPAPRAAYVMPAWQQERANAMAAAKAIAMATGRAVRA
jgi:hypothetical protein